MELTTMTIGRRRGLRGWLRGDGPPSLRAVVFLAVSTFLCGCVLASLLFVGIWRHTASEAARNHDAELQTKAIQQRDRQRLHAAQQTLAAVKARLAHNLSLLAAAERRAASAEKGVARAQTADRALVHSLAAPLQELADTAGALARQTATIQSELTALEAYAQNPGGTGVDPGYLGTQAQYVARQAAAASSAASALAQRAREAQATAGTG